MLNWARITTVILSAFFIFPSAVEILTAFRDLNFLKLVLNLAFVTLQGMIIWYLLLPDTRRAFETPFTELHLK
jgi:hypothetical protein